MAGSVPLLPHGATKSGVRTTRTAVALVLGAAAAAAACAVFTAGVGYYAHLVLVECVKGSQMSVLSIFTLQSHYILTFENLWTSMASMRSPRQAERTQKPKPRLRAAATRRSLRPAELVIHISWSSTTS